MIQKKIIKLFFSTNLRFNIDVEKQEEFLKKFPKPKNNIVRGYFQYKCQMYLIGKPKTLLLNFLSFLILPHIIIWLCFKTIAKEKENINNYEILIFNKEISLEKIPQDFLKYSSYILYNKKTKYILDFKVLKWLITNIIIRYPFSYYFILKSFINLSKYNYLIEKFNPNIIASAIEYSFCSSLITEFLHTRKCKHFNYMHGEKLFFIRDAFVSFDKFFVWDIHYKNLFSKLLAKVDTIYVSPLKMHTYNTIKEKYDYIYYFAAENRLDIKKIFYNLNILKERGKIICIRLHPKWSNSKVIYKENKKYQFLIDNENNIVLSILSTKNVISLFSTVIYQAYLLNKNIIIDDVTNSLKFEKLKKMYYIGMQKKYKKLSNILINYKE